MFDVVDTRKIKVRKRATGRALTLKQEKDGNFLKTNSMGPPSRSPIFLGNKPNLFLGPMLPEREKTRFERSRSCSHLLAEAMRRDVKKAERFLPTVGSSHCHLDTNTHTTPSWIPDKSISKHSDDQTFRSKAMISHPEENRKDTARAPRPSPKPDFDGQLLFHPERSQGGPLQEGEDGEDDLHDPCDRPGQWIEDGSGTPWPRPPARSHGMHR